MGGTGMVSFFIVPVLCISYLSKNLDLPKNYLEVLPKKN
jgi:hypothetical protein